MRTTDLVVKTYPQDYDWLPYLFKSIARYARGYRNIIILLEEQYPEPDGLPANAVVKRSRRYVGTPIPSNMGAVIERLRAFAYTDAERLIFVDSDCVFIREIDFQTDPLINIEKPNVFWRAWEEAGLGVCWRAPAGVALGYEPKLETMAGYPFCYTRKTMEAFWEFVGGEDRLLYLGSFTDWNAIGNFALDKCPDEVTKVHAYSPPAPPCVRQFWSWHRANHPEVQAELRTLGLVED